MTNYTRLQILNTELCFIDVHLYKLKSIGTNRKIMENGFDEVQNVKIYKSFHNEFLLWLPNFPYTVYWKTENNKKKNDQKKYS